MRIAIVEDEPRIREGIHKLLARTNDSFIVVGEAKTFNRHVVLALLGVTLFFYLSLACFRSPLIRLELFIRSNIGEYPALIPPMDGVIKPEINGLKFRELT